MVTEEGTVTNVDPEGAVVGVETWRYVIVAAEVGALKSSPHAITLIAVLKASSAPVKVPPLVTR
jgi:hypothetical protein